MALGFVSTATASRVIFSERGEGLFGLVMVMATIQAVIPFADLGLGAVVMNSIAKDNRANPARVDAELRRVLVTLIVVAFAISALVLLASAMGLFELAAGDLIAFTPSINGWITVAALAVGWSVPLGMGYRILVGLNRTHVAVLVSAVSPITVALGMGLILLTGPDSFDAFIALWPISVLVANLLTFAVAIHSLGRGVRPFLSRSSGIEVNRILSTSASMLLISIATPAIYQTHRLVLLQVGTAGDLAQYSMGAQMYGPLLSVLTIAATPLWPQFAGSENAVERRSLARRATLGFAGIGLGAAAIYLGSTPIYAWFVSGEWGYVPWHVLGLFAGLLALNASVFPTFMRMNQGRAIRWQAIWAVVAAAVSVPLSLVLAPPLGAAGPLLAAILSLGVLQVLPLSLYLRYSRPDQGGVSGGLPLLQATSEESGHGR